MVGYEGIDAELECFAIIKEVNESQLNNTLLLEIGMLVSPVLSPMHWV